jgi:hypothetical protein
MSKEKIMSDVIKEIQIKMAMTTTTHLSEWPKSKH